MSRPAPFELSALVLSTLAIASVVVAYRKDRGRQHAVIPHEKLRRDFGHGSGPKAIPNTAGAGVLTPGRFMVSALFPSYPPPPASRAALSSPA